MNVSILMVGVPIHVSIHRVVFTADVLVVTPFNLTDEDVQVCTYVVKMWSMIYLAYCAYES